MGLAEYLGLYVLASIIAALGFAVLMYWAEMREERLDNQKG